jgi:hypothetical protein
MDPLKCQTATASPAEPGELPIGLGERIEEVFGAYGKCPGELHNVLQSYIAFATFDAADVVPMQPSSFRQLFLGVAAFLSQGSQRRPEDGLNRSFRHSLMLVE